jgi:DNA-directed RNA polymerase subunit RPC12/RpoP
MRCKHCGKEVVKEDDPHDPRGYSLRSGPDSASIVTMVYNCQRGGKKWGAHEYDETFEVKQIIAKYDTSNS